MNAADQLALFDPDGADAMRLLNAYIRQAEMHAKQADHFELLGMPGAEARADALMNEALRAAHVFAAYLDLLGLAGEVE